MDTPTIEQKKGTRNKAKKVLPKKTARIIDLDQALKIVLSSDLNKRVNPIYLTLEQKIIIRELLYSKLQNIVDDTQFNDEDSAIKNTALSIYYKRQTELIEDVIAQLYK